MEHRRENARVVVHRSLRDGNTPRQDMRILTRREVELIDHIALTFFPHGPDRGLDADEAGVVGYIDRFIAGLPLPEQLKMRALLQIMEYGIAVTTMNPFARFTRVTDDERADYLRSWERSTNPARRGIFQALRSLVTIAWYESAAVREGLGTERHEDRIQEELLRMLAASGVAVKGGGHFEPETSMLTEEGHVGSGASAETDAALASIVPRTPDAPAATAP